MIAILDRLLSKLRSFARSRDAVAAIEFALVFPGARVLYVGAVEVADGVMTSRKVTSVTHTLVDLLSKQQTSTQATSAPPPPSALPATTLATLLSSSATLLYPKPTSQLKMTLTAIDVKNTSAGVCCNATVRWSYTQNGVLRPCNQQITGTGNAEVGPTELPAQLLPYGIPLLQPFSILVSETSYTYQPLFSAAVLPFSPTMRRAEYMMPRTTGQVVTGSLAGSGAQSGKVCY